MILTMLDRFLPGTERDLSGMVEVMTQAVTEYPLAAVAEACRCFMDGEVARENRFVPNAVELVTEVRRHLPPPPRDRNDIRDMRNLTIVPIGKPMPAGMQPAGMLSVDFGHGKIDLSRMSFTEQLKVLENKGLPKRVVAAPAMKRIGA